MVVGVLAFVENVVGSWRFGICGESGWWGGEGGEAMLAVVGKVVRMVWFVEMWLWWWKCGWSKITIAKEKHYLKDHSPVTRIIPS